MDESFRSEMAAGYTLTEPTIVLGSPMLGDEVLSDVRVQIALSRVNRHGLIAGATGTGKTKTLQLFAGQLSALGVPVFAVDVKGDLSGIGAPGDGTDQRTIDRCTSLAWTFQAAGHPVEILSLSGKTGAHVRASVSSFGPLLLGKVLDLNDTQTSILSMVFRYCDDQNLPLLDLEDLRTTLKYLGSDDGKPVLEDLGGISPASLGVILRAIVTIEQDGADVFFGEPEFDVDDLHAGSDRRGKGMITLLEVADVMDQPRLYSTFVLWMLARLYEHLPEIGDRRQADARLLLRRGAPAVQGRVAGPAGRDRAHRAPDPEQGRRRLLRHPGAHRRPVAGALAARQPDPARPPRVHARRRRRAAQDGSDVPGDHPLRRRTDDHEPRHRGGARHRPVAQGRPDATRGDPARATGFRGWHR